MSWLSKNPSSGKPPASGDTHHAKKFKSSKPPHEVVSTELCDCPGGQARGECFGGYVSEEE